MSVRRSAAYLAAPLAVLSLVGSACGRDESASVARELGAVQARMDEVDREIRAMKPVEPTSRASVQTWVRQMKEELPRYEPIQEDALAAHDEAEDVDDEDVRSAADLLVEMVRHRHDVMRSFVQAVGREPLTQQLQLLELRALEDEETKRMDEEWAELAQLLSERYATVSTPEAGFGASPCDPDATAQREERKPIRSVPCLTRRER